jgi:hypothetical protein
LFLERTIDSTIIIIIIANAMIWARSTNFAASTTMIVTWQADGLGLPVVVVVVVAR